MKDRLIRLPEEVIVISESIIVNPKPDRYIGLDDIDLSDPAKLFNGIEQFYSLTEGSDANLNQFSDLINEGLVPVLYANHQSHVDGRILFSISQKVKRSVAESKKLEGFNLPYAVSIGSGDQGDGIKQIFELFDHFYDAENFRMLPVTRQADRDKFGIKDSSLIVLKTIMQAPDLNYGMAIFPEGTMKGGRMMNGEINGMQKVDERGLLTSFLRRWQNRGVVLMPLGINGSNRIMNPDNGSINAHFLGIISGNENLEELAHVAAGKPFIVNSENFKNISMDLLMNKVSELLPEEARGYYSTIKRN